MKGTTNIAAIVELGNSHDECLYSQILFLKQAGYVVHLLLSEGLKFQEDNFPGADAVYYFLLPQKGFKNWKELIKIKRYIKQQSISRVIFNTATGNTIRNFILLNLFTTVSFAGTVHHTGKLVKSFTQRIISLRVKKYFVLNDYLLNSIKVHKALQVTSYYPIFFPNYRPVDLVKPAGDFWICVPGQLEFKRRDYRTLLTQLNKEDLPKELKFILLGRCNHKYGNGAEIKAMINQQGLEKHFILFDNFIDNALFHAYLKLSDVILPLLHEGSEGFTSYATAQVSGAFNLAFAYRKPLLMHYYFNEIPDFKISAFFYDTPHLIQQCLLLCRQPSLCYPKTAAAATYTKFDFTFQQQQYLKLLTLY